MDGFDKLSKRLASMADPAQQKRRLSAARCPIHGQTPTNVERRGTQFTYEVCCDRLAKLAAEAVIAA